jgi:hypothetical protein
VALAGLLALAVAATGVVVQSQPPSHAVRVARAGAIEHPAARQTCRTLDQVTYCAFPEFSRWIPAWRDVVQAVLAATPAAHRPSRLAVRQRVVGSTASTDLVRGWRADDVAAGTPDAVAATTRWGDSRSAADLAALVAHRVLTGAGPGGGVAACGGTGVLTVWLAAQAGALATTGIRKLTDSHGVSFAEAGALPGVDVPRAEVTVALAALDLPASRVRDSWDALTGATVARAAQILGVPAPAATDPAGRCA